MEQNEVFEFVLRKLEELGFRYMVVGSVASIFYGEPRMTLDMDVVLELEMQDIERFCAAFPADEFYVSSKAVFEAITHRTQFNIIHPDSGNKIDFMVVRDDAWSRQQISGRTSRKLLAGRSAYVARPEDVILSKMMYYREGGSDKHLRDIAGMLKISGEIIDRGYVEKWARQMDVLDIWQAILARLS